MNRTGMAVLLAGMLLLVLGMREMRAGIDPTVPRPDLVSDGTSSAPVPSMPYGFTEGMLGAPGAATPYAFTEGMLGSMVGHSTR